MSREEMRRRCRLGRDTRDSEMTSISISKLEIAPCRFLGGGNVNQLSWEAAELVKCLP